MKIGISGAQGTGKTTLVNKLKDLSMFEKYEFNTNMTRRVKEMGFNINEEGDDQTQRVIFRAHINLLNKPNFISDRTLIDALMYTILLAKRGRCSPSLAVSSYSLALDKVKQYDYIFVVRPEFDIVDDGVRSTDVDFRDTIDTLMLQFIENHNIPYHLLTGAVEERVQQLKDVINGKQDNRTSK